ncbi:unnamed protein product [Linum trigynum]|uniref:Uncharacterized protein n=1 Tax=Linum trigynum TaxID=586398 RepID=A0AAV2FDE2_9ROSI
MLPIAVTAASRRTSASPPSDPDDDPSPPLRRSRPPRIANHVGSTSAGTRCSLATQGLPVSFASFAARGEVV